MFDAVAVTYIIMVLLILLGAWLHCKDLTASLQFTAYVIVTAPVIIIVLCIVFGIMAFIACTVHGYNFIDVLRKCSYKTDKKVWRL